MIVFKNLKTGETKNAFSLREDGEKTYVRFSSGEKEYGYSKHNIEIITAENVEMPFCVYTYMKECYKCHKSTEILTYITYADNSMENVTYPYNYDRLLAQQDVVAHLQDPSIEYYGIKVIGDIDEFDQLLIKKYPDRIKYIYSRTQNGIYPMNVCSHCGSGQGWYFIYRDINKMINSKLKLELFTEPTNNDEQNI